MYKLKFSIKLNYNCICDRDDHIYFLCSSKFSVNHDFEAWRYELDCLESRLDSLPIWMTFCFPWPQIWKNRTSQNQTVKNILSNTPTSESVLRKVYFSSNQSWLHVSKSVQKNSFAILWFLTRNFRCHYQLTVFEQVPNFFPHFQRLAIYFHFLDSRKNDLVWRIQWRLPEGQFVHQQATPSAVPNKMSQLQDNWI